MSVFDFELDGEHFLVPFQPYLQQLLQQICYICIEIDPTDLERSMVEVDRRLLEEESASDVSLIDLSLPPAQRSESMPGPACKSITTRQGTIITTVPGPVRTRSCSRRSGGRSAQGKGKGKTIPPAPSPSPAPAPLPPPPAPTPLPLVAQERHTTVPAAVKPPASPSYQTVCLHNFGLI